MFSESLAFLNGIINVHILEINFGDKEFANFGPMPL